MIFYFQKSIKKEYLILILNYNIYHFYHKWWSFLKQEKLIATIANYIPFTKLPNIKKVKKVKLLKVEDVMIENNLVTEDKQNPFSERKLKQLKKSH
jgi:hypothetical protein